MPKVQYITQRFSIHSRETITDINNVIAEYSKQGFVLTLRQLYYQFVARDLIPNIRKWKWTGSKWVRDSNGTKNAMPNYKWLGSVVNDARLAGQIDWLAIEDRTRNTLSLAHWNNPREIIEDAPREYHIDKWENQKNRPYVWIEKDALVGVIEGVCNEFDVPYFSCRGYTSQSEMWRSAQSFLVDIENGQKPVVLHLGDHDPSGIDMTRDIIDRLRMFAGKITVKRLALNIEQVRKFKPPPNPAKRDDSRYRNYVRQFGRQCWELDAVEPKVLADLVRKAVMKLRNAAAWKRAVRRESEDRRKLRSIVLSLR